MPGLACVTPASAPSALRQRLAGRVRPQTILDADDLRPRLGEHHLVVAQQRIVRERDAHGRQAGRKRQVSDDVPAGTSTSRREHVFRRAGRAR